LRRTFQQGLAVPELTVRGYLQLAARRRMSAEEVEELMEFVGGPSNQMIAEVDVGARRLIEMAANLAARPRVLLLDEPGAGLAARESLRLARQITSIPARFGCGVLLIEHDMTMVAEACSSIVALNFGKVIAAGSVSEVLQHEDVVDAYLGSEAVTA
jgi:branched-chain amino acid transport system permease protein